jgi:dephospho-CoA kinase
LTWSPNLQSAICNLQSAIAMPYNNVYLIGLTGNIACGKSTVLAMLRERGARVLDADRVTHELQRPGEPVYAAIVTAFGAGILAEPGGPIDRRKLGAIVFADPAALRRLEQIVHPAVRERITAWLASLRLEARGLRREDESESQASSLKPQASPIAVIDAIKLLEGGWKQVCDAIWVVTCRPEQQLERLIAARGMSEEEARGRIAAQPPQADKVALADVVIDNSGALEQTRQQVDAAWAAIHTG